jgi:C-terminal processing protease CtpA/Prc
LILLWLFAALPALGCGAGDDDDGRPIAADDDASESDDDDDDDNDNDNNDDDNDDSEGPYYQDYLRYWRTMDQGYAYFIEKDVDWDAVYAATAPLARQIDNVADFQLLLARTTAALRDSHTFSELSAVPANRAPARPSTGVCLVRANGLVFLSRLTAEAEAAGMRLGDEVTALDGEFPDDVLAHAADWEGCSTRQCCDAWRLPHADRYSAGRDEVEFSLRRDGAPFTATLVRAGAGEGVCAPQPTLDFQASCEGTHVKRRWIDADLGYVALASLDEAWADPIAAELDLALAIFAGADGLIFDARRNRGGSDLVAMRVLARFLDEVVWPVVVRYKDGPAHDDFTPWVPEPLLPGLDPWRKPVVFLIDGGCISAADFLVAGASLVPAFTLMGVTSCGATGAPRYDTLPDSHTTYYYSQMQRRYLPTGEQIEGLGVSPDVYIELDRDDLAAGLDTQIEAAIAFLRGRGAYPN